MSFDYLIVLNYNFIYLFLQTKLAPGLSLKKKGVSSLVAKWQQVQEDVRRDMKHD